MIRISASSRWPMNKISSRKEPMPTNQASQGSRKNVTSDKGDNLDLDHHVARQPRHFDGGACRRIGAKIFRPAVNLVHGGKIVHVLDEHRGLDRAGEIAAGGLQDGAEVLQHLMGLLGDAAR